MAKRETNEQSPLALDPQPPRLVGIARLATLGESLEAGHNVQFHTIPTRSLLNRCPARSRMPFRWTINPYRGCEFACKYCYARYTFEYMDRDPLDFERNIYVKESSAWLLRRNSAEWVPGNPSRSAPPPIPTSPRKVAIGSLAPSSKCCRGRRTRDRHRHQIQPRCSAISTCLKPSPPATRCASTSR